MAISMWRTALDALPESLVSSREKGEIRASILIKKLFSVQDVEQAVDICGGNQEALVGVFKALLPVTPFVPAALVNKKDQAPQNRKDQDMLQKKKLNSELWSGASTIMLLELYEDTLCMTNRGSLNRKHWSSIAEALNSRCGTIFKASQCKNRWDALRKAFHKEKAHEKGTGLISEWPFYEQCNRILEKSAKTEGLKGGFNGEEFLNDSTKEEFSDSEELFEDSAVSKMATTPVDQPGPSNAEGEDGKRVRKRRKLSIGSIGDKVERGMSKFAETIKEIEQARLKEESRRLDKVIEVQLQIAQILSKASSAAQGRS